MSTPETDEPCTCRDVLDIPRLSAEVETRSKWNASGFRAEMRAIEQGHRAFLMAGVSRNRHRSAAKVREKLLDWEWDRLRFKVVSNCRHGLKHYQTVHLQPGNKRSPARIGCTCEGGTYREWAPIPCKHAALVARRLEREGLLEWHDGLWWHPAAWTRAQLHEAETTHVDEHPDDPFEGLAP